MKVQTARFGVIDVHDDAVVTMVRGLFGFERLRRFTLLERPGIAPFQWLQSVEDPEVAFVVVDPWMICPDFDPQLCERDAEALDWLAAGWGPVRAIVGVPADVGKMTANLKAPILFDRPMRRACQVIVTNEAYSARTPLIGPAGRAAPATAPVPRTSTPESGSKHAVHG